VLLDRRRARLTNKPIKPKRPIENIARGVALLICMAVPGVWVALHATAIAMTLAGAEPSQLDPYIAGMNNLVLLVTGAAIALAFQTAPNAPIKDLPPETANVFKED